LANVVLAIGTSHSPVLALDAPDWETRARNDRANKALFDTAGTRCSYDELAERVGDRYAAKAVTSRWQEQATALNRSLDRLGADLAEANPDVVIVVGDDEHELFSSANMPALSMYYGDAVVTRQFARPDDPRANDPEYAWMRMVARMYGMDESRSFPGSAKFSLELIERLIDAGFDVGAASAVPEPARYGFGHAYGFVAMRLMGDRKIPMVPVLLNTYFPPNQPTPKRCHDLGVALRRAVEDSPSDLRVALIASGGLSHFVTNEDLDLQVLDALREGRGDSLRGVSPVLLNSGSSEIRNWITLGGATSDLKHAWSDYIPVYRTPAGTGIGLAFARWS
jgi:hypothetical protein